MSAANAKCETMRCLFALVVGAVYTAAQTPSPGCGGKGLLEPGEEATFRAVVGGRTRWFLLKVPESYSPTTPQPLVMSVHGWRSNMVEQHDDDRFDILADESGFVAVWPDGYGDGPCDDGATSDDGFPMTWNSWNGAGSTRSPGPEGPICIREKSFCYKSCEKKTGGCDVECDWTSCADDDEYVTVLLDTLESRLCIDRDRVYATGFSNGGIFSWHLSMTHADRFAALSPGGGQPFLGFLNYSGTAVERGHRVSILDIHGSEDTICPAYGGLSTNDTKNEFYDCDGWAYVPVPSATRAAAQAHGCHGDDKRIVDANDRPMGAKPFSDVFTCYRHGVCGDGQEFVRCLWDSGHYWPHTEANPHIGSRMVWEFFSKHSRSRPAAPAGATVDVTKETTDEYRRVQKEFLRGLGTCPQ